MCSSDLFYTIIREFVAKKSSIMKKILISAAIVVSLLGFYNCKEKTSETKNLTKEITFTKEGELTLMKAENDSIIAKLRSEEHTSELQSRENLVCRLLLEKKKHIKWKR